MQCGKRMSWLNSEIEGGKEDIPAQFPSADSVKKKKDSKNDAESIEEEEKLKAETWARATTVHAATFNPS